MQVSEILRKLADIADKQEPLQVIVPSKLTPVIVPNDDTSDDVSMVPPLQQKHELLKKATGVENLVDRFSNDTDDTDDALATIKSLAGIGEEPCDQLSIADINPKKNAALLHFASDDFES